MNCFVDTNVPIAFIFRIDPFNHKSNSVFRRYDSIFWSEFVKCECEKAFNKKLNILTRFYRGLLKDLKIDGFNDFSFKDLIRYFRQKSYDGKDGKRIESSLSVFWDEYVSESFPSYENFKTAVTSCIHDLQFESHKRKRGWYGQVKLTEKRVKSYFDLKRMLDDFGVHPSDNRVILDAHDHNLRTDFDLDFVTFDKLCFDGANLESFSFHEVKFITNFTF